MGTERRAFSVVVDSLSNSLSRDTHLSPPLLAFVGVQRQSYLGELITYWAPACHSVVLRFVATCIRMVLKFDTL